MFGFMKPLARVIYHLVMTLEHQHRAIELVSIDKSLMAGIELEKAKEHLDQGKAQAEILLKKPFKSWNKD